MKRLGYILLLLIFISLQSAQGQKVKYKDLFPQLNSKNYEEAIPKIGQFISNPKDRAYPNATLQYGLYFEHRFLTSDILDDTTSVINAADSAVVMLSRAKGLITEKELKKNDEYYQNFFRRDVRTGEFGIKVSDVHLDIEKKVEALEARKTLFRTIHDNLRKINNKYNNSVKFYKMLASSSEDYRALLMSIGEQQEFMLQTILTNSTGLYPLIDEVRKTAREMEIEKYTDREVFKLVENFPEDGVEQVDVYSGKLELWDYDKWASKATEDYEGLKIFRKKLLAIENQIYNANNLIKEGKTPPQIVWQPFLQEDIDFYDPECLPTDFFDFKLLELQVAQKLDTTQNPAVNDSSNVVVQLQIADEIIGLYGQMEEVLAKVSKDRIEKMKLSYADLVDNVYGGPEGLDNFVDTKNQEVTQQKEAWSKRDGELSERAKWAYSETDTVGLTVGFHRSKKVLGVVGEEIAVAYGVDTLEEKNSGFIVWSGPERGIDQIQNFDIGQIRLDSMVTDTLPTPNLGFYLFDETLDEKNLALVYTDGMGSVSWTNIITAARKPESFRFDRTLEQLTVFFYPQDKLPEGGDEVGYVVIDRNGNVR